MSDIAQLGIEIDSSDAKSAKNSLDELTKSAARTEVAADKLSAASRQTNIALSEQRVTARQAAQGVEQLASRTVAAEQAYKSASRATQAQAIAMRTAGLSARQYSQSMRLLPAQITDIVTSLVSGQPAYMVAIQQGGQLKDSFGGVGNALRALSTVLTPTRVLVGALGVGAVVAAKAIMAAERESMAFTKAIAFSGNAAGVTATQLAHMAEEMDGIRGTQAAAAASIATLAATGKVAGRNLQEFALVAQSLKDNVGIPIEETAKTFAELARDPVNASKKLNEQYNYLTAAVYAQIKALTNEGKIREAGEVAQKAYSAAQDERTKKIEANLRGLQLAARSTGKFFSEMWDGIVGNFRADSLDKKIAEIDRSLQLSASGAAGSRNLGRDPTARLRARKAQLQEEKRIEEEAAATTARRIVEEEAGIRRIDLMERIAQERRTAAKQLRDEQLSSSQSGVQRGLAEALSQYTLYERGLESARNTGLVSERAYYDEKKRLIEQSMFTRVKALNEENALLRQNADDIKRISAGDVERLGADPDKEADRIRIRADAERKLLANQERIADNEQRIRELRRDAAAEAKTLTDAQTESAGAILKNLREQTEEYEAQAQAARGVAGAVEDLQRRRQLDRLGIKETPEIKAAKTDRNAAQYDELIANMEKELRLLGMTSRAREVEAITRGLSAAATAQQVQKIAELANAQSRAGSFNAEIQGLQSEYEGQRLKSARELYAELEFLRQTNLISEAAAVEAENVIHQKAASERREGVQNLLSDLASLSGSESRKAFRLAKAAAVAQATINTYESAVKAYNSLANIPYVGPVLGAAAAGAAIAAGVANINRIQNTPQGFMRGGYTGDKPTNEVAGVVHGREYVMNAQATNRIGRGTLDRLSTGASQVIDRAANAGTYQPPPMKVSVINNAGARIETQQLSETEVRIMVNREIAKQTPRLVSSEIANPNSAISKSLGRNTQAPRKRM